MNVWKSVIMYLYHLCKLFLFFFFILFSVGTSGFNLGLAFSYLTLNCMHCIERLPNYWGLTLWIIVRQYSNERAKISTTITNACSSMQVFLESPSFVAIPQWSRIFFSIWILDQSRYIHNFTLIHHQFILNWCFFDILLCPFVICYSKLYQISISAVWVSGLHTCAFFLCVNLIEIHSTSSVACN